MSNNYEAIPLNGPNTLTTEISNASINTNDEPGAVNPWLDRFVTALVVALICCFIVSTTTGGLQVAQSTAQVEFRPYCVVPTSRYSENVRVIQTSLGEPARKWAPQECIISTKDQNSFQDAYGAPDAVFSVRLDDIAHPDRPPILGFGGAFTEASALNFRSLSPEGQETVLQLLFGELGYSLGRVPINSCDFSVKSYAYDTVDGDFNLTHFSIDHDLQSGMIDLMKRAKDVYAQHWNGTNFKLFASPWSPPAWMKAPTPDDASNAKHAKSMTNSAQPVCLRDGVGPDSKYAETWALYFAKFIEAYQSHGLDMYAVTIQNEPEFPAPWEACSQTKETMADFLAHHLGPMLEKAFPTTKIFIFDHNKDHAPVWIDYILNNQAAAKYVGGTAIHWYAGSTDRLLDGAQGAANMHRVMSQLKNISSKLDTAESTSPVRRHIVLGSEACHCPTTGYAGGDIAIAWARAERYAHSILADLAAGSQGWVEWNLLLDSVGGPNHLGNLCDASLLAVPHRASNWSGPFHDYENAHHPFGKVVGDEQTREELHALGYPVDLLDRGVVAQPLFYYMGHISKFVRPGSRAIPGLVEQSQHGQTFRTIEGISGGGLNNLARQGVEVTVWPCEGSTRQQFSWNEENHQLQVFGHDWVGVPTVSCIGQENNQDFLGVTTGSCNVTDGFAGTFDIILASDNSDMRSVNGVKIMVTNADVSDSCLVVQPLHNEGGAYGPRGGAQVAVGNCDLEAALWTFNVVSGELSSSFFDKPVCMTTGWPFLQIGAFDTPSITATSEKVVVVLNEAAQSANYVLKDGKTIIMAGAIPPRSVQTILID